MASLKTISKSTIRINLPDVSQQLNWSCGAAALLSILTYFGKGPLNEEQVGKELKMKNSGTDPYQIKNVLKKFGLKFQEYRGMTIPQLKKCIDAKKPVLIMLQAWGDTKKYTKCRRGCKDGHWLIAIGYDNVNIYFEDPALNISVGYIKTTALDKRWHDYECLSEKDRTKHHTDHYGLVVWGRKGKMNRIQVEEIL